MPRQYAREPLSSDEGNRLIQACETLRERQVILILLDTGLRVSELAQLTKQHILWQERRLAIHGKGGPYGKRSKRRVLPMTDRVRLLIEHHYTMQDTLWHHGPPDRADCEAGGEPCRDRQAGDAARVAAHLLGELLTTRHHHPDPAISPGA